MAIDIKKTAIGLGCAAVIAFVIGRSYSSSDNGEYQPITSLAHLDQTNLDTTNELTPDLPEAAVAEDAILLPAEEVEDTPTVLESENQVLPWDSEFSEFTEPDQDFIELELSGEPLPAAPQPILDTPAIDEATDQSMQLANQPIETTDQPIETIDQPEILDSPILSVDSAETTDPVTSIQSLRSKTKWKQNPFLSTNSPAVSPVERNSDPKVKPASMATTGQAVRSLNVIPGIPAAPIPEPTPTAAATQIPTPTTAVASAQTTGMTADLGTQVAPIQMGLTDSAAQKAVHHIEYGKSLTRRGASYAARNEFFSALRVIAEANDEMINGNDFSRALSKAIRAMKEAEDFSTNDAQSYAVVDVPATIESHKTKLLTAIEARQITPQNAMRRYYTYAGQQLDFAGGRNVVTAEALHCLGKLHSVISSQQPVSAGKLDVSQAIVFHRSSLLSNPNNSASANELGVLLAKSGDLHEATNLFKQSLITHSTPQAWSNLAKTHHRLGEQQLAQMAKAEISVAAQSTSIATAGIKWVGTPEFNAMAPVEFEPRIAQKTPKVAPPATDLKKAEEDKKPKISIAKRIKEWF